MPRVIRDLNQQPQNIRLSPRDTRLVLKLLKHPPAPNARLRAAARSLPR